MEPRAHGRIVRSNGRGSPLRHRHPREATQTAGLAVADLVRPHRPFDREGHNEGLHQEAPEIDAQPEVPHFGGVSDGEGESGVLQDSADSTTGGALPALWGLSNMRPQRTAVGWRMQEGGGQVIAAQRLEALRKSLDDAWNHSTELEDQIADGAEVELDRASVREIRAFVLAALGRVREAKA
jgi:hypothetical protein